LGRPVNQVTDIMKSIRWDRRRRCFVLSDGTPAEPFNDFAVDTVLDVSLSSLRRALARQAGISIPPLMSLPSVAYMSDSEVKDSISHGTSEVVFHSNDDESNVVFLSLTQQGHIYAHFPVESPAIVDRNIVIEIAERVSGDGYKLARLEWVDLSGIDELPAWSFDFICDPAGRTVESLWRTHHTLCFALTTLPEDLVRSVGGIQHALRLGRSDVLIGVQESSWLDVKEMDYRLSSAAEKIKLAQDVARFANADGGLLALGFKTSQSGGVEIISRVTPLPMPARSVARYRSIIDRHVYPFVRGLEVFSAPCGKGELLTISIPPQAEDDKPFVVHGNLGSITDNKVKGLFVSVAERRGDGAEYLSGPVIHSRLVRRSRSDK
jgi:hypothetical protein